MLTPADYTTLNLVFHLSLALAPAEWQGWSFADPPSYPPASPTAWHQLSPSISPGTSETPKVICKDELEVCV